MWWKCEFVTDYIYMITFNSVNWDWQENQKEKLMAGKRGGEVEESVTAGRWGWQDMKQQQGSNQKVKTYKAGSRHQGKSQQSS